MSFCSVSTMRKQMYKRAQLSVEVVIIVGVFLLVASTLLFVFSQRQSDVAFEQQRVSAQAIVDNVALTVVSVYVAGPQAEGTVYVPATIRGLPLTLSFAEHVVLLSWGDFVVSAPISAPINASMQVDTLPQHVTFTHTGEMVDVSS